MGEPFYLRHSEIARLTDRQIFDHYLCKRDESGRPVRERSIALGARPTQAQADAALVALACDFGQSEIAFELLKAKRERGQTRPEIPAEFPPLPPEAYESP